MMEIVKDGLKEAMQIYSDASLGGMLFTVFLLIVLVLLLYRKDEDKNAVRWFILPVLVLIPLILNPFVAHFLCTHSMYDRLIRFLWLIPVEIVFAYAIVRLAYLQNGAKKHIVICAVALILLLNGNLLRSEYQHRDNWYKLPQYAVDTAEIISRNKSGDITLVAAEENTAMWLRQYDGNILLVVESMYGEMSPVINGEKIDISALGMMAQENKSEFIVIRAEQNPNGLAPIGYSEVGRSEYADGSVYIVYQITEKERE